LDGKFGLLDGDVVGNMWTEIDKIKLPKDELALFSLLSSIIFVDIWASLRPIAMLDQILLWICRLLVAVL
jgi:hypothetical protein